MNTEKLIHPEIRKAPRPWEWKLLYISRENICKPEKQQKNALKRKETGKEDK